VKYKATKTHLVFKMSRTEYNRLCNVLTIGIEDLSDTSLPAYRTDMKLAQAFKAVDENPDEEPKFKPVEEADES
jgi:hypothetical protein